MALPASPQFLVAAEVFGFDPAALWLEVGFGAGEHLAWQAERYPEVGFIGVEYFINGIASLLRLAAERGLENVRIYEGDGRELLDFLPERSIDRTFVLFPDPWPKARHHRRRFIRRDTLDDLARVMTDGAELRMATDDGSYLLWTLEQTCTHPAFRWLARGPADWRQRPADWPASRYELKAIAAGRRPTYLRFARRPRRPA